MQTKRTKIFKKQNRDLSDCSDTCESLPRQVPAKIIQKAVKHNFQKLTAVPIVSNTANIKQLYLSHNCLSSLKGIEMYTGLTSLNISYNCLSKISELRMLINPRLIKLISLRMNNFQYGYEDYTVGLFCNLQRLDDCQIEKNEIKQKMFKLRSNLAGGLIQFMRRCHLIVDSIQQYKNKENFSAESNIQAKDKLKTKEKLFQEHPKRIFQILKDYYIQHNERSLARKSIRQLITLASTVVDLVNSADIYIPFNSSQSYGQIINHIFEDICDQILTKFKKRHDNRLTMFLQKNINQGSYITAFSQLGVIHQKEFNFQKQCKMIAGANKSPDIDINPAKYMQRINPAALKQHPMNFLANWAPPEYDTLISQRDTKWYKFYHSKNKTIEHKEPVYEQFPVFIYCKEYLEVLTQIVFDEIGLILNLNHRYATRPQITQNNIQDVQIQKEDDIQLNLSDSEIMSFGNRQQINQLPANKPQHYDEIAQNQNESQLEKYQKIDAKFAPNHQKPAEPDFRTNLTKFSLYEINLIFKTLRGLKQRVKKRKSKKGVQAENYIR